MHNMRPDVSKEWGELRVVALVRPDFFQIVAPVNSTQQLFYGTDLEPRADVLCREHDLVKAALARQGIQIVDIPADPRFPMQFNVRDPAVVIHDRVVLGRMVREARWGEEEAIARALAQWADPILPSAGTVEGGDVIVAPDSVYVGLSQRTSRQGLEALRSCLGEAIVVEPILLADHVLHLDMVLNLVGAGTGIIHRQSVVEIPSSLGAYDWIEVTDEEYLEQAANVLSLGGRTVMLDERHQRVASEFERRGFECVAVGLKEIAKVGGGVRCMTLPLVRE